MIRLYYLLSRQYSTYYDSNGALIADSFTALLDWFRNREGVMGVYEQDVNIPCSPYKVFAVDGKGIMPSYIMADGVQPRNWIFGKRLSFFNPNLIELCNGVDIKVLCAQPVVGSIGVVSATCDTPTLGSIVITAINAIYAISNSTSWTVDQDVSSASKNGNSVSITIYTVNASQSGSLQAATIGNLDAAVWPLQTITLDHAAQSQIPSGVTLQITTGGAIKYTGTPNVSSTVIGLSNIIYLIDNA